jgi:drug/metabolite transporter (DMT)-like permease
MLNIGQYLIPAISGIVFTLGDVITNYIPTKVNSFDYIITRNIYLGLLSICLLIFMEYGTKREVTMNILKLKPLSRQFNIVIISMLAQILGISFVIYSVRNYNIGLSILIVNIAAIITGLILGYIIKNEQVGIKKGIGIIFAIISIILCV